MKSFTSRIILIFFSLVIFTITVFSISNLLDSKKISQLVMEDNLSNLVKEKQKTLYLEMSQIEAELEELSYWMEKYQTIVDFKKSTYTIDQDARYLEYQDDDQVSLFLNSQIQITEEIEKDIFYSKLLEDNFKRSLEKNLDIVCIYLISNKGLLRVYPYMNRSQLRPDYDFRMDHYYTYALEESNGESKPVWTNPYYDWADRGLVVTCAYPVYSEGEISYTIFADVTLSSLQEEIADFKIKEFGYGFLVDNKGEVIYHPDYIQHSYIKGEKLDNNILELSSDENLNNIIKKMLAGKSNQEFFVNSIGIKNFITYAPIETTNWSLAFLVKSKEYETDLNAYLSLYFFGPLGLVIIFACFIYIILKKNSQYLVNLSKKAEILALGKSSSLNKIKGGDEIETIDNSLNTLNYNLKNHMEALLDSKLKLEVVFNSMNNILFVVNKEYEMININDYSKNLIDEELLIDKSYCYKYFKDRDKICSNCPIENTFTTGREAFKETLWEGDIYHVKTYPIFNRDKSVEEVVVYASKETDRIILEKEFYQREKLASIGQISAAITHELRKPIGVINGSSYLLKDIINNSKLTTDEIIELNEIIREIDLSIDNSSSIINELLDFSRKSNSNYQKVDLIYLLKQVLLLNKKNIIESNIELLENYPSVPVYIYGNVDSLRLIFINLIDNAIYEMKSGGKLTVDINLLYNENMVEILISDSGNGMDSKTLANIFKAFYSSKPNKLGNGIGMWLVKREVSKNSGIINIESSLGIGTNIYLKFKLHKNTKGECNV